MYAPAFARQPTIESYTLRMCLHRSALIMPIRAITRASPEKVQHILSVLSGLGQDRPRMSRRFPVRKYAGQWCRATRHPRMFVGRTGDVALGRPKKQTPGTNREGLNCQVGLHRPKGHRRRPRLCSVQYCTGERTAGLADMHRSIPTRSCCPITFSLFAPAEDVHPVGEWVLV